MAVNNASGLGLSSAVKPKSLNVGVTGFARATYSATTGAPTITTRSDGKVSANTIDFSASVAEIS